MMHLSYDSSNLSLIALETMRLLAGSRQIDDRIAGSRARVVLTDRYNLVNSG